jgi:o-succinylbenzoate synthase
VATGAITRVRLGRYRFPFRAPWPSVDGPQSHREGIVLVLEDDDGRIGVGESAPYPGFGMESLGSSLSALRLAARFALGMPAEAFLPAAADLARLAPVVASPGARTAIDFALHDLTAQRAGVSVARLLGGEAARPGAYANAALPRGTLAETETAARAAVDAGARCVKLKVGGAPIAEDVARVRAARLAIGADARLRVDANQAWREDEAIEALRAMEPFRLEYAEQPLPAGAIDALARVRAATGVAIAADEAIYDARAARRVAAAGAADVFIVKPMALGGLAAAREVIGVARDAGIRVTVTTLLDAAVGRAGALHLAASLGDDGDHGLATGSALAEDILEEVADRPGYVPLPIGEGLGAVLREHAAARTEPIAADVST